jgi:hypothetical protein
VSLREEREVGFMRRSEHFFERLRSKQSPLWKERKDSATTIVDHDYAQVDPSISEANQTIRVVQERDIPDEERRRARRAEGCTDCRRDNAINAVGTAIRQHGDVRTRTRIPLNIAYRHRRRHNYLRIVR